MDFKLKYFEEAYTTENWMIRIYRVKDRGNRDDIEFSDVDQKEISFQSLSGLTDNFAANTYVKSNYLHKNII